MSVLNGESYCEYILQKCNKWTRSGRESQGLAGQDLPDRSAQLRKDVSTLYNSNRLVGLTIFELQNLDLCQISPSVDDSLRLLGQVVNGNDQFEGSLRSKFQQSWDVVGSCEDDSKMRMINTKGCVRVKSVMIE